MKKHKGQSVVEFALVLPLFLFIMFGVIYTGMMFHDYSTLSNIARACTREAAVSDTYNYNTIRDFYEPKLNSLMTSFYKPAGEHPIHIGHDVHDKKDDNGNVILDGDGNTVKEVDYNIVITTINMQLNVSGFFTDMILPKAFGVQYYMKKEPFTSSPSS